MGDAVQQMDLLDLVQPTTGWFAIVGIKGAGDVRQELVATREEADEVIESFAQQQRNVFFGVAKYATGDNRTKENVKALKALWLDIDCGEAKVAVDPNTGRPDGYIDQTAALIALEDFCEVVGLPRPTIVNSGRGIHAYWPLEEEVTRVQWEQVATRFQQVCRTQNFYVDDKVFEVARILRVPGTFNYKGDEPLPVEIMSVGDVSSLGEFRSILGVTSKTPTLEEPWTPADSQTPQGGIGYNFARIMNRSVSGDGCNQILQAYINRASLSYYEWFYALSVAARCEDAPTAVHKLSKGHEGYDPAAVDKKVATIKKSTSCAKFRSVNPELCEGCPHLGSIFGPRDLGKVAIESEDEVVVVESDEGDEVSYHIPKYPKPFYRGEEGGVWRLPPKDSEEADPIWVYELDLYVVKRMKDSEGISVFMRLHTPHDGVEEFAIPMSKVTQKDELRKALSARGVVSAGKRFDMLMDYILLSAKQLQKEERSEIMRQQFGWADNNSKFIIGEQEITAEGTFYSPPSKATRSLAKFMGPVGSLEKWKEVWSLYGVEGIEAHAFAALSTFGSPLLMFLNQTGAVINLYNAHSGTGKTTVLNMSNSVWGHPKELRLKEIDTFNGKLQWVGVLNNLAPTMDEVTNAKAEDYSVFLYSLSNGKGKERMLSGSNELRENNTTWCSITISTSNSSFAEKLSVLKANPEGELMRLIEYPIGLVQAVNNAEAKNLFDQVLFSNYGHAGPIFIRYVLSNMEQVRALCLRIQSKIDRELGLLPKERFWSATLAANIVGGIIAFKCGLIDWDMDRIYMWACDRVEKLRVDTTPPLDSVEQIIGDYLYRHMQNILVVDDEVDKRTKLLAAPKREPKGELLIRIEPDTKMMFVISKPFKEYCVKYQIDYADTLDKLEAQGRLVKKKGKRLSKGMSVSGDPVHCLWFKLTDDFLSVDEYAKVDETADAD